MALANAQLYEEAGRRRQEAEFAARIARTLNSSLDLGVVLQRVVEGARELCRSDMARIALADPESGEMVFRYWVNARFEGYRSIRVTPGRGLGGRVLLTRQSVRTDNWLLDPALLEGDPAVIEAEGIVTQMAAPIRSGDRVEGLLYVDNRSPRAFTDRDEAVLMGLADTAAIAIRNAQIFQAAQTTGARLQTLSATPARRPGGGAPSPRAGAPRRGGAGAHRGADQPADAAARRRRPARRAHRLDDCLAVVDRVSRRRAPALARPPALDARRPRAGVRASAGTSTPRRSVPGSRPA